MTRTALITGAAGGLGQAATTMLQSRGWRVAGVSRDAARLSGTSEQFLPIQADVSTGAGAEQALAACMEAFGAPPDALIHAVGSTLLAPLHRTDEDTYRQTLAANLDSAFFTLRAYVQAALKAKRPGKVVLVSSVVARVGVSNHEAIAMAKGGIEALVRSAAATYSPQGIRINAIAPGLTRTPATERLFSAQTAEEQIRAQYPLGRYGAAEDLARAACWLVSEEADWITGQVLPVDGGFTAVRPMVRAR
ncbi:short-chain dehydrogenase/reductase SDR [Thioalkalivibrio sulfidiphilus HL-EbGr7]|uniref:Short-chain dehydrogenase/reductase SDR n=1 Tax=Thioalkalivibrio sulfidiphilus (strain HL-EbGR7) TaxID=396588 RepID=B8GR60_THISH|nr:SDR family oxidoreductase [Thioalkalivibrio sulfidiphilus]ACL72480.1 short-chain dehydrogenase/reductase SDR [Thioalkalivibrio sulfidiphilus HL-EbGr7]